MLTSTSDLSDLQLPPGQRVARQQVEGIDVVAVRVGYSQHLGTLGRMRSFLRFMLQSSWLAIRASGHDVVIATSTPLTVGIPGMLASWRWRIPLVFEVRDLWPEAPIQMGIIRNPLLQALLRAVERLIYRRSTHVIALSPGMRDGVLAAGTPAAKVSVITNCSDLDLFRPGPPDPVHRQKFELEGCFVAVYAGAMGEANAVDVVVDAAAQLQAEGCDRIRFLLVGQGKQTDAVRARTEMLGLKNIVFAGSLPRQEVPELLRLGDVCLVLFKNVPVLGTNSPNKLFDALAAGRPVIVNSAGWTRDLVITHQVGCWAQPGSAASLAATLRGLAEEPERVRAMGRNARRLAETQFDRLALAAEFEKVLKTATGQLPSTVLLPPSVPRMPQAAAAPAPAATVRCSQEIEAR
jgi:glycosyltransferase involved in cell wall biosynthesis